MSAAFRAPGVTAGGAAQSRTRQQQQRYPHADLKVFPGSVPVTKPPQCSRIMSKRTSDEAIKVDEFPVAATRRAALAAGVFWAVAEAGVGTPPAAASALGDFWRSRQAQNGGAKILAPVRVAERKIQEARNTLSESSTADDYRAILPLVHAASLNCYIYDVDENNTTFEERASLYQQSLGGAIEVCTFKLLLKNVALNATDDLLVSKAADACDQVVRSFPLLDLAITRKSEMEDVPFSDIDRAFQETLDALYLFETSLQQCLGVA